MNKTAPALINHEVLVWARETVGYSAQEASNKLGVAPDRLAQWESNALKPSVAQLKTIARVYKRPFACFYLPARPVDTAPPRDFRRIHEAAEYEDVVALNLAIRGVEFRREAAVELASLIKESIPEFPHTLDLQTNPELAGQRIREVLGVRTEVQRSWREPRVGFNAWRSIMEKAGVLVCQFSGVNLDEARGFSLGEFPLPAVAVNSKDAPTGRTFTLIHELVHVMLRQSGTCDIVEDYRRRPDTQRIEIYCNSVAGNTLVPLTELKALLKPDSTTPRNLDVTLSTLAREFCVSRAVILRRLYTINAIGKTSFEKKHHELIDEYERQKKELALRNKGKKIIVPPARRLVANAGIKYVGLVMEALNQRKISLSDVSDYFGVRLRHLPRIQAELERRWVESAPSK